MTYVIAALLIGLLILVHELGHLLAAKWMGIPVARFSIGFGPKLVGWKWGETEYWLAPIPLGGYVLPAVENDDEFLRYSIGKRIVFSLGGPAANVLLPVVLFAAMNVATDGVSIAGLFVDPWLQTAELFGRILIALPMAFVHHDQLSGVVGIVAIGDEVVRAGWVAAANFAAVLSVNLAILNLLPLPPLDGGKIVMFLMEKVHPRVARLHLPLALAGWAALLALMAYTTFLDIGRHVVG